MDPNAPRGNPWPDEPDTYWRRRFFALAAGLGILGLLAWACSGALSGAGAPRPANVASSAAAAQSAATSGQPATAASGQAATSQAASGGGAGGSRASGSPAASPTAAARHGRKVRIPPARHRSGRGCAPADVVVSLFTSQQTYQHAASPQFTIAVVNTSRSACSFAVGARSLRLVVKSGQVRVWSPADCTRAGTVTEMARLSRGVPYVTHVSWNRIRSSPHCASSRLTAAPGTYTATVTSGAVHSDTDVFVLR